MIRSPLLVTALAALATPATLATACASTPDASAQANAAGANASADEKKSAARAQLGELAAKVATFESNTGNCPTSFEEMMQPPQGDPLIASVPDDPWGQPVAFMPATGEGPGAMVSGGPDGELLTDDDISVRTSCSAR